MRPAFRLSHHPTLRTFPSAPSARAEPGAGPDTARTAGLPGPVSIIPSGRSLAQSGPPEPGRAGSLAGDGSRPCHPEPGLTFAPFRCPSTRRRRRHRIEGQAQFCVPHFVCVIIQHIPRRHPLRQPERSPGQARTPHGQPELSGHVSIIPSGRSLAQPGPRDPSGPAALRETAAAPATRRPGLTFAPLRRPSTRRRRRHRIEGLAQIRVPRFGCVII